MYLDYVIYFIYVWDSIPWQSMQQLQMREWCRTAIQSIRFTFPISTASVCKMSMAAVHLSICNCRASRWPLAVFHRKNCKSWKGGEVVEQRHSIQGVYLRRARRLFRSLCLFIFSLCIRGNNDLSPQTTWHHQLPGMVKLVRLLVTAGMYHYM